MAAKAVFCGYGRSHPRTAGSVLECLLREAVQKISARMDWLKNEHTKGKKTTRPSMTEVIDMLRDELQDFSESFSIVGRIDKLHSDEEILTLLKVLKTLLGTAKIMITSRTRFGHADFQAYLENASTGSLFLPGSASIDMTEQSAGGAGRISLHELATMRGGW